MKAEKAPMADIQQNREQTSSNAGLWEPFVFDPSALIPPEQPIYEGLLAKGDLAIWLGREKHRKSCVLLQFAICAALGRPFLHFPFRPDHGLKVVVLDYESKSQTIQNRHAAIVAAMGLSKGEQEILRSYLQIVEMRKAFRNGLKFARFPVKPEKGNIDEFSQAETEWRLFVQNMAADLYVIDPMRCMHAQAENDSALEALLTRVHQIFGDSAVVISHHLRKRDRRKDNQRSLIGDMRVFADEARGSGTITAHADVIVCQERIVDNGAEMLHLGAYLRDGADIEPMVLRESASESFLWQVAPDIPLELTLCLDELRKSPQGFPSRTAAAAVLQHTIGAGRSTAFTRINDLVSRGLLIDCDGTLKVKEMVDGVGNTQ
jgi:AAA domain